MQQTKCCLRRAPLSPKPKFCSFARLTSPHGRYALCGHPCAPTSLPPLLRYPIPQAECSRYFGGDSLRPVVYAGPTKARRQIAERLGLGLAANGKNTVDTADVRSDNTSNGDATAGHAGSPGGETTASPTAATGGRREEPERHANVVITSYNVLRTDSEILGQQVCKFIAHGSENSFFSFSSTL